MSVAPWRLTIEGRQKNAFAFAIAKMLNYRTPKSGAYSYQAKYRHHIERRIARGFADSLPMRAVNCPPAGVIVKPKPRVCRAYSICPFCYARGAYVDFQAISNALGIGVNGVGEQAPAYGASLASRTIKIDELLTSDYGPRDYAYRSFFEFFRDRSMRIGGVAIRSREFNALGAIGWLERAWVSPKLGHFRCELRQLIALPADAPTPPDFVRCEVRNDFELASPFAAAMRYQQWLIVHEDVWPSVQYQLSRAAQALPLVLRGGCFRKAITRKAGISHVHARTDAQDR